MKVLTTAILVLVISTCIAGSLALRGESGPVDKPSLQSPTNLTEEVAANGVVEGARPEIGLRTEVAGAIATVNCHENQDVTQGMLLVELQNGTQQQQVGLAEAELTIAQAQLERLRNGEQPEKRRALAASENARRAVYDQAVADLERSKKLVGDYSASREQFDRDRFRVQGSLAELAQAQAERAVVEAPARADEVKAAEGRVAVAEARVRLAQAELAKTRLRAPSAGRILRVHAEPGEMAQPSSPQPILLLADLSRRRVRAFVEELDALRVQVGQRAVVTAEGLPGKEFAGKVSLVMPRMGKRSPQSDEAGEYKDVYFREVLIDLDAANDLPLNLRVRTRLQAGPAGAVP